MSNRDKNTTFFYNYIKRRANRNRITIICRSDGSITTIEMEIKVEVVGFFQSLISNDFAILTSKVNLVACNLVTSPISSDMAAVMVRDVSGEESHKACFSLRPNKAPASDGLNSIFFQKAWPIIDLTPL